MTAPMRIVHFVHGYFPECEGGTENYLRSLVAAQREAGHDVTIVAGSFEPWAECGLEEGSFEEVRVVRVHRNDHYYDYHGKHYHPGVERVLREWLAEHRPDIVHVQQWLRLTCNLVEIAESLGIPAVVTIHDLYTTCPRVFRVRPDDEPCFRTMSVESCVDCVPGYGHETPAEKARGIEQFALEYRTELQRARRRLIATRATAELLVDSAGAAMDSFDFLPLGYERRFAGRRSQPWREGEPLRFGFWGLISRRKGGVTLIDAFAQLCRESLSRPVELHVYGRVDTEELRAELDERKGDAPTWFHGRYEYDQLAEAGLHVAIFPAACFETFGFVLDEAIELGLPVLTTAIGAIPERAAGAAIVEPTPPSDAGAMAEALRRVVDDHALIERARRALPQLPPTPTEHATMVDAAYREALGATPNAVEGVSPLRRAEWLLIEREAALRAAWPDQGPY